MPFETTGLTVTEACEQERVKVKKADTEEESIVIVEEPS